MTGHGMRSITGVEVGLDVNSATQQQFEAIPGIGSKSAWRMVSARAKAASKGEAFDSVESAFAAASLDFPAAANSVLSCDA